MKFLFLYTLMILVACSARPTLEQLEAEANKSGDWRAVERREELILKRTQNTAPGCPVRMSKRCFQDGIGVQCICMPTVDRLGSR